MCTHVCTVPHRTYVRARTHTRCIPPAERVYAAEPTLHVSFRFPHCRQEHEDARARAIRRYVLDAFNSPYDNVRSDSSNPLSRPNRLTATNPLLD